MEKSCWTCNWLRLWKLYGSATKRKALLKKASIKSHLEFSQRFVWDSNIDWKKVLWSDETKTKQYVWQKHTCIHSFIFIYFPGLTGIGRCDHPSVIFSGLSPKTSQALCQFHPCRICYLLRLPQTTTTDTFKSEGSVMHPGSSQVSKIPTSPCSLSQK